MFDIVRAYCNSKITALNSSLTNDLTETTINLDIDKLPANQLNTYYQIRLDGYKLEDSNESQVLYSADVVIKFTFGLYNKDVTHYASIVDDYIHSLMRILKRRNTGGTRLPYTSSGVIISKIDNLEATGLNEITGNYLQPEIKFKALILDNSSVTLIPPSAPTLTSPADGSSSGTLDQAFNWTGTADSWEIKISTGGTTVIQQAGLTTSSYTVPADNLLTNATLYSWTVRGYNEAGAGDWATAFTFTVNDAFVYEPETLAYQTRVLADAGEIISLDAVNNAILDAKTNGYWNNVKSWVDPQFGIKKDGSNNVSKIYCLCGFDIIGTNTPLYNATGLNNLPALTFNGTSNYMTVPNVGLGLTSGEVFIAGIRDADPPTIPTSGFWFYGTQSGVDNHVPYSDGNIYDGWGTSERKTVGNPTSSLASKFLYNISSASGAWTARLNGTQIFTTATNVVGFRSAPILGKSEGAYYYKGKFGGLLLMNTVLTATQRALVNTFFNTKYAIY